MSEDLYDPYSEDILGEGEEEPEEELSEEEGQNKTFMIAVAALGGLLVLAIVLFGVWAFVINPKMQRQAAAVPSVTETAALEGSVTPQPSGEAVANVTGGTEKKGATATVPAETSVQPTATHTPRPTSTPRPTNTPVIGATNTPTPVPTEENGGVGAASVSSKATVTPTLPPRRTPTATPSPTATATPSPVPTRTPRVSHATDVTPSSTPDTGWGEMLLLAAALGLLGVLFIARRLRKVN